ncbi:hypothetical protein CCR75_005032 [Bremia lactucae]|uniref:Uncharacterized protein n=1 Tax=Bremia lactucae TaxID=4779 RepID=A0A976IEE9_BRELC|nr:hypothetical protein CCR75_005032 [Bremia lactucae]
MRPPMNECLSGTIQAQAKGELRFLLSRGSSIPASRSHTQAVNEEILLLQKLSRSTGTTYTTYCTTPPSRLFSTSNSNLHRFHSRERFTGSKTSMDHPQDQHVSVNWEQIVPRPSRLWSIRFDYTTSPGSWI